MNNVYIYNDDFLSLLNLIVYLIKNNIKPFKIKNNSYNPTLFEQTIKLNIKKNENIIDNIIKNFGKYAFKSMYYTFLSNDENKELILYYFFKNALKYKKKIIYIRKLKCVHETLRISEYVLHEAHKLKGFIRFRELDNKILYAEIEPTNDVLLIVSNHFKRRLKNENWIIKDVKRGILSVYDKENLYLFYEEDFSLATNLISNEEKQIEDLWKLFYKTISIKERKNEKVRRNFMPKKYWKYITEVRDEL